MIHCGWDLDSNRSVQHERDTISDSWMKDQNKFVVQTCESVRFMPFFRFDFQEYRFKRFFNLKSCQICYDRQRFPMDMMYVHLCADGIYGRFRGSLEVEMIAPSQESEIEKRLIHFHLVSSQVEHCGRDKSDSWILFYTRCIQSLPSVLGWNSLNTICRKCKKIKWKSFFKVHNIFWEVGGLGG